VTLYPAAKAFSRIATENRFEDGEERKREIERRREEQRWLTEEQRWRREAMTGTLSRRDEQR
jgi:hypothetical protein